MSTEAFKKAYAPDRIGRPWGYKSNDYTGGYHRGLDVREVHPSGNYSVVTEVIAISDGFVDYVGRPSTALGPTVRIRRDAGGYEFHSHTVYYARVGQRTTAGTLLGRNATLSERPGLIAGVHDHIVFSDFADGAWNTSRATKDPYPFIQSALASLSGGGGKPFNPEEDDMGTIDNTEENYQTMAAFLQRALKWDVRDGSDGTGATMWDRLGNLGDRVIAVPSQVWEAQIPAQTPDGINQDVTFPARGFIASTNAQIGALREVIATLAVGQGLDPKAIEDAAERGTLNALERIKLVPEVK